MSTLQQHTSPDRRRIAARPGTVLALSALIAIGLALLILCRPATAQPRRPRAASHGHPRRPPPSPPKRRPQAAASATRPPTLSPVPRVRQLRPPPPSQRATSATQPRTSSCAFPPHGTAQDNIRPIILAVAPFRKTGWIKGGTPNQGPSTHPKPRHRNARGVTTIALHPPDASRRASASRRRGLDPSSALNECRGCRGVRPRHRLRDCRIVPAAAGRR